MPHQLGKRFALSDDGKSAEIVVLLDFVFKIYLGETFHEKAIDFRAESGFIEIGYDSNCALRIDYREEDYIEYFRFRWQTPPDNLRNLKDTFYLDNAKWFGGAIVPNIHWPMNGQNDTYHLTPYVVNAVFNVPMSGQERYWLSSQRIALNVPSYIPLWTELDNGYLKFQAQIDDSPYANFEYSNSTFLEYEIAVGKGTADGRGHALSLRDFHQKCFETYLKSPLKIPDELMIAKPIWSTWARFKKEVNQSSVTKFYDEIVSKRFPISHLELDDKWMTEYGDFEVDTAKFPDFNAMAERIIVDGGRLTAWIHPFINRESKNGQNQSLRKYFIKSTLANETAAGGGAALSKWWDGEAAYSVDFTNPEAVAWYDGKLLELQEKNKIFSYKFDAGELDMLPKHFTLYDGNEPNDYVRAYVRNAATTFRSAVEIRAGSGTQDTSIFFRTMDRNSNWNDVGLQTLIPSALHCSLHGYFWMLPDMVGGNGYDGKLPPKELFIRWTQANTFLMAIQFSFAPFDYDLETRASAHDMLYLREKWMPYIIDEAKKAVKTKQPIIRPMWWASELPEAITISDQYMVGDRLLVAPVLTESARSRRVFIPEGEWRDGNTDEFVSGPTTIDVPASLNTLPFFVRRDGNETKSSSASNITSIQNILLMLAICVILCLWRTPH